MPLGAPTHPGEAPPKVEWFWEGLAPMGYITLLYGPEGSLKTALASALAVEAARPGGGELLGRRVRGGGVAYLNADDPPGLSLGAWLSRFLANRRDALPERIRVYPVDGGLAPKDLEALGQELAGNPPVLIILDSFYSAFPGLALNEPHKVAAVMLALGRLAARLSAALLLLDHVGKLGQGENVADKGALGARAKSYASRSVVAVEPGGRAGLVRLVPTKNSFAPLPGPLTVRVEVRAEGDRERGAVVLAEGGKGHRAEDALLALLAEAGPQGLLRRELLERAAERTGLPAITVRRALEGLEQRGLVRATRVQGRGNPVRVSLSFGEEGGPLSPTLMSTNAENAVQDGADLCSSPLSTNQGSEEEKRDGNGKGFVLMPDEHKKPLQEMEALKAAWELVEAIRKEQPELAQAFSIRLNRSARGEAGRILAELHAALAQR